MGKVIQELCQKQWRIIKSVAMRLREAYVGICTMWNSNELELATSKQTQHCIYINLISKETENHYHLFNIYVLMHYKQKEEWWKTLMSEINSLGIGNIIITRDLNTILSFEEKSGGG